MGEPAEDRQDYYDLEGLARATGVSTRTVRRWVDDAENPLPSHNVRVGAKDRGRVIIARDEFDAWVKQFPAGAKRMAKARARTHAPSPMDADVAAAVRSIRGG